MDRNWTKVTKENVRACKSYLRAWRDVGDLRDWFRSEHVSMNFLRINRNSRKVEKKGWWLIRHSEVNELVQEDCCRLRRRFVLDSRCFANSFSVSSSIASPSVSVVSAVFSGTGLLVDETLSSEVGFVDEWCFPRFLWLDVTDELLLSTGR